MPVQSGWQDSTYQKILIHSGSDATDSSLQEWLDNNATLIEPDLSNVNLSYHITTAGNYTIKTTALATGYEESDYSNIITTTAYAITTAIVGGKIIMNQALILSNTSKTIKLIPESKYILPPFIQVNGADYDYNSTTGEIILSNATANVSIVAVCEEINAIVFVSDYAFTLKTQDLVKHWSGDIYYTGDYKASSWSEWTGTEKISAVKDYRDNKFKLYLRGINNTYLTGKTNNSAYKWVLTGVYPQIQSFIDCYGNIENLLSYQTVTNGSHPSLGNYCFANLFYSCTALRTPPDLLSTTLTTYAYCYMFYNCTNLIHAPIIEATTLNTYCCDGMFYQCSKLEELPRLKATTLKNYCYRNMFRSCSKIKLSTSTSSTYPNSFRIPKSGSGTTGTNSMQYMFTGTGGSLTGTPTINTTYYTSNDIIANSDVIIPNGNYSFANTCWKLNEVLDFSDVTYQSSHYLLGIAMLYTNDDGTWNTEGIEGDELNLGRESSSSNTGQLTNADGDGYNYGNYEDPYPYFRFLYFLSEIDYNYLTYFNNSKALIEFLKFLFKNAQKINDSDIPYLPLPTNN